MQKNSNRRGLALGAIFALVASLFVSAPAQAATDGADIGVYPVAENGTTSSAFVGVLDQDFPIYFQGKGSYALPTGNVVVKVEKTAGTNMDVIISASSVVNDLTTITASSPVASRSDVIKAGSTSETVSMIVTGGTPSIAHLNVKAYSTSGIASWSPVTLKVTIWVDTQGAVQNDIINSDEPFTTQTITLLHPSAIPATVTLTAPAQGDTTVTASATVTGVNLANLGGNFFLAFSSSAALYTNGTAISVAGTNAPDSATVHLRGGVVSESVSVASVSGSQTVVAQLRYTTGSATIAASQLVKAASAVATSQSLANLYVGAVVSDHVTNSALANSASAVTAHVRPNQTYTIRVGATSASKSVSGAVVKVAMTGPALTLPASSLIVNGGTATTSYPTALEVTTGADGFGTFTFATTGVAAEQSFTFRVSLGNLQTQLLTLTTKAPVFSVVPEYSIFAAAPGAAVVMNFDVEDQWQVASKRTDQRIMVERGGDTGFAYAETKSYVAVVAGKASFTFNPTPATKTGSATVTPTLQQLDQDSNVWSAGTAFAAVTVNVTDKASGFSTASAVLSTSASVSYAVASGKYSESGEITVTSVVAGVDIKVDAKGLIIINDGDTYSDTATIRSNSSGQVALKFAGAKSGTYTVTYTTGAASTTSTVVIDKPAADAGKDITVDKSSIMAGETTTITGTLVDANGNGVQTSGSADVVVSWTGKGLPFNTGTIETDADGKFTVNVLVLSTETGTGTLTATYRPAGSASDTKNITVAKTITIATPAAPAAPEVNAVIGTFNGRWAVRVENAKGAVVAVKVGGNWFKYTSLNENYLFSRKSAVGRSVAVAVYVNGTLENVATITIK